MAHLVSSEVFTPGFRSRSIQTEDTNKELKDFTAEDVSFILHLLAYHNTRYNKVATMLERDYGLKIHAITLRRWVSSSFPEKYVQIQHELQQELNKKLSAKTVDIADRALEATDMAVTEGMKSIGDLKPNEISAAAKNYADVASKTIEKGALLEDRPTSIVKNQTPDDALKILEELGLMKKPEVIEAESVEEEG